MFKLIRNNMRCNQKFKKKWGTTKKKETKEERDIKRIKKTKNSLWILKKKNENIKNIKENKIKTRIIKLKKWNK